MKYTSAHTKKIIIRKSSDCSMMENLHSTAKGKSRTGQEFMIVIPKHLSLCLYLPVADVAY